MEKPIAIIGVLIMMWFYMQKQLIFQDFMVISMVILIVLTALKKK